MNYITSPNYKAKSNLKDLGDLSLSQGDILYYDGTNLAKLGAGTSGQFLKTQGAGANPIWDSPTGSGDVVGPSSATDNAIVRFDSTTGKLIQDSVVTIGDTGDMAGVGTINTLNLPSSDFVGLTDTQTLTNKTFTSPVINSPTGIVWADIDKTTSDIADITTKSHTSLTDIGTNTHAQIDTHIASTSNPHSVVASQVNITDSGSYYNSSDVEDALAELGELNRSNGYDLLTPASLPDLAWDDATRTLTLSVKSGSSNFYFWSNGKKFTKTSSESIVIPDTTGTYYIYYDSTGTLQYVLESSIADIEFYEYAITGLVYWNATSGKGMAGDERHGKDMSGRDHEYEHMTLGARYGSGMDITGMTDGGATYTNIASGVYWDEDIKHEVALHTDTPFLYKLGSGGEWTGTTADTNVAYKNGGSNAVWNEWTGTTWQLTQLASGGWGSGEYVIMFIIATPDFASGYHYKKIIGQNKYTSRSAARNALETEKSNIITDGLPSPEFVFLYAYIVKYDANVEADADGNVYYDLREAKGGGAGTSTQANLAGDVQTDTTNFNKILSSTDTDVQTALDTIDDHTHTASDITDFDTEVSNNTDVAANTAKVTESTTVTAPLSLSGYDISIPVATSSANGYLSSTDWTTFNGKQDALSLPLSAANGGTGLDTSGSSGIPKLTTGTWTIDATTDDLTEGTTNKYDIDHFTGKTQDDLGDGTTYKQYNPASVAITGGSISGITDLAIADGGTGASDAAGARTNLGVDPAGTDNSTNVTLAGTPDYITISGQEITRNQIDLTADVTGLLPDANISSASTWNGKIANVSEDTTPDLGGDLDTNAHTIKSKKHTYTGVVGTTTVDWTKGHKAYFTFGAGNETLAFTAPTATAGYQESLQLVVKQDTTGSRTITWPSTVKWVSGTAPTLTTTASAIDIISFLYDSDDSAYYGIASLNFS